MSLIKGIFCGVLLLVSTLSQAAEMNPRQRDIPLTEFTKFSVDVVPDLGVRFIFPFLLNENDDIVPFQSVMTNNAVFDIDRPGVSKDGQSSKDIPHNMFVLTVKKSGLCGKDNALCSNGVPEHLGTLFITAGGYNISIKLRSTGHLKKHYEDIVFQLTIDERTHLINRAVDARMKNIEKKVAEQLQGLDQRVEQKAKAYIGFLAIQTPKEHSIKEEFEPRFKEGGQAVIYLEHILVYDTYFMLVFEVENKSAFDINVSGLELSQVVNESQSTIEGDLSCEMQWRPNKINRCVIVTQSRALLEAKKLMLSVATDRGQVDVSW